MRHRRRGSLLVVTLWLVTMLAVLAVAIGRFLSREVRLARYHTVRQQAKAFARGGVYLAMERLRQDAEQDEVDWLADDWASPTPSASESAWLIDVPSAGSATAQRRGTLVIRIIDEERKFNLNASGEAPADPLAAAARRLLSGLDVPSELAARLGDYIDADNEPRDPGGLESDVGQPPSYITKGGPLLSWSELLEIPGMAELKPVTLGALRSHSSVFLGADRHVNVNTVHPDVLVVLGFSSNSAQALQLCRNNGTVFTDQATLLTTLEACLGADGLTSEETTLAGTYFATVSNTFTVVSEAVIDDRSPVRARIEAVIRRTGCPSDAEACIVAWVEG